MKTYTPKKYWNSFWKVRAFKYVYGDNEHKPLLDLARSLMGNKIDIR